MKLITFVFFIVACGTPEETIQNHKYDINGQGTLPFTVTYYPKLLACTPLNRLEQVVHVSFDKSLATTLDNFWQRNCPSNTDCSSAYYYNYADYMEFATQGDRFISCSIKAGAPIYGACWFVDSELDCFDYFILSKVTSIPNF